MGSTKERSKKTRNMAKRGMREKADFLKVSGSRWK